MATDQLKLSRIPPDLLIFRDCLIEYRKNLVLLVPAAISLLFSIVSLHVFSGFVLSSFVSNMNINPYVLMQTLAALLSYTLLGILVETAVYVGYASMTAKIVKEGVCAFSDWKNGLRKYFLRILAITMVLSLLVTVLLGLAVAGGVAFFLMFGEGVPYQPPTFLLFGLLTTLLLTTLIDVFRYSCYAAATIDDADVASSITRGLKAMRHGGKPMLVLLVTVYVAFVDTSYAQSIAAFSTSLGSTFSPPSVSLLGILTTAVSSVLTPFILLVTFTIYREVSLRKP